MPIERAAIVVFAILASGARLTAQDEADDYQYQERTVIEATLQEVLARPEFRRLVAKPEPAPTPDPEESSETPAWLERFLDWLSGWGSRDESEAPAAPPIGGLGVGATYLVYALAAAALLAALYLLLKSIFASLSGARERDIPREPIRASIARSGAAPSETAPEEFWARAEGLASRGHYKAAIRELLLGAMSTVERRGLIRHRRGLTNRDYLSATRGAMRESMQTIVATFELVYFGRRNASEEGFRECALSYRRVFGADTEREAP